MAPELIGELGEPFGKLWRLLVDTYGPPDAARVMARVLGAIVDHGADPVREAVVHALASDRLDLLTVAIPSRPRPRSIAVPAGLQGYEVEKIPASDFDVLLAEADHE